MQMLTFTMKTNGEKSTVMAPNKPAAIGIAEKAYRAKHGLPSSYTVMASVTGQIGAVPVTNDGLVGVK